MKSGQIDTKPNFFIVGASKAGSTTLHNYLKNHSQIFMSEIKEPCFFSRDYTKDSIELIKDEKQYLKLFKKRKNEIMVGESSSTYLQDIQTPHLIKQYVPNAKIIILLRNPVKRSYSHYLMENRLTNNSFRDEIIRNLEDNANNVYQNDIISSSFYAKALKRYFQIFGKQNIKIVIFENFSKDPESVVKDILIFLGVNYKDFKIIRRHDNKYHKIKHKYFFKLWTNKKIKKMFRRLLSQSLKTFFYKKFFSDYTQKPKMLLSDRKFLTDFFFNDVAQTQKLIDKKLEWMDFPMIYDDSVSFSED